MSRTEGTIWCDGCGVEILWAPIVIDELDYCCKDCSEGLQCSCGERMDLDDDRQGS